MSSPTGPAEPSPACRPAPAGARVLQLLLGVAYPFLAHAAGTRGGSWAVLALADLILLLLAVPLLRRRWWALGLLAAALAALAALDGTPWPGLLLLAPPVLFTGWVAAWFGRSLLPGRSPLMAAVTGSPAKAVLSDGTAAAVVLGGVARVVLLSMGLKGGRGRSRPISRCGRPRPRSR